MIDDLNPILDAVKGLSPVIIAISIPASYLRIFIVGYVYGFNLF